MKKITLTITILLGLFNVQAQQLKGQKVASVKVGFSATGFLINAIGSGGNNFSNGGSTDTDSFTIGSITTNKIPAISATYDFGVTNRFSIGGIASFQAFSGNITNYVRFGKTDTTYIPNVDFKLKRIFIGVAPKLHWRSDNTKTDFYSALRVGYILWANKIDAPNDKFNALNRFNAGRPAVALVPVGVNFYFNENFGGNVELAFGAPYIFSLGASYRF